MNENNVDTIWHYTNMDAFLQIVQNGTLRFSSAAQLNDTEEITWVATVYKNARTDEGEQLDETALQLLKECDLPREFADRTSPLVACFSLDPDVLTQWREYADGGKGIAIGFDREWLMGNLDRHPSSRHLTLFRQRVEYLKHNASLGELYQSLCKIGAKNKDTYSLNDPCPFNWLATPFVKNASFQEEKEYRICYSPGVFEPGNPSQPPPEQHRVTSSGRLVPYVDLRISEPKKKVPISAVVLGPQNVNSEEAIKRFFWKQHNSTPEISRSTGTSRR